MKRLSQLVLEKSSKKVEKKECLPPSEGHLREV